MFDDHVVVYKALGDLMFYVTGDTEENELILYTVLQAFYESVSILLRCVCAKVARVRGAERRAATARGGA